jgi:hypothetical protein
VIHFSKIWRGAEFFDREYPTTVRTGETFRAFYNSPVHEQWLLHVAVWWGDVRQDILGAQRVESAWQQILSSTFCLRDLYLDGKHMIRSCLDLVAIAIDGSIGSDVQDQLRDSPRNQKMTHAGMLEQCHQYIGTGSIMLKGYRTSTG